MRAIVSTVERKKVMAGVRDKVWEYADQQCALHNDAQTATDNTFAWLKRKANAAVLARYSDELVRDAIEKRVLASRYERLARLKQVAYEAATSDIPSGAVSASASHKEREQFLNNRAKIARAGLLEEYMLENGMPLGNMLVSELKHHAENEIGRGQAVRERAIFQAKCLVAWEPRAKEGDRCRDVATPGDNLEKWLDEARKEARRADAAIGRKYGIDT